jgi:hypothetical protein
MGKRSKFERRDRDSYPTPFPAVPPLIPHLRGIRTFAETCAGDGALVRHLQMFGLHCAYAGDITTGEDALAIGSYGDIDAIITNTPWKRPVLHAMIGHFVRIAPVVWLLIDQDWACTKQAIPHLPCCTDILPIGRLIWIPGGDARLGQRRLVSLRHPPHGWPRFPPIPLGACRITRNTMRAMRQAVPAAAIELEILFRHLSPACPPQPAWRDIA